MSLSPWAASDGRPTHHIFTTDSGTFSLSGVQNSSITLHLEDINNNEALYVCTGTWIAIGSLNGEGNEAYFFPSTTDVLATNPLGKAGMYEAYPVVTLSSGPVSFDAQILQVVSEP